MKGLTMHRISILALAALAGVAIILLTAVTSYGASPAVHIGWELDGTVLHVADGDTITVNLPASDFRAVEAIRIYGINAPESLKRNARCAKEQRLGLIAKAWARSKMPDGSKVRLRVHAIHNAPQTVLERVSEPYGRLIADVILPDGSDYGALALKYGNASVYFGRGPKFNWCR